MVGRQSSSGIIYVERSVMWSGQLIATVERAGGGIQLNIIDNRAKGLRAVRDEKHISP